MPPDALKPTLRAGLWQLSSTIRNVPWFQTIRNVPLGFFLNITGWGWVAERRERSDRSGATHPHPERRDDGGRGGRLATATPRLGLCGFQSLNRLGGPATRLDSLTLRTRLCPCRAIGQFAISREQTHAAVELIADRHTLAWLQAAATRKL